LRLFFAEIDCTLRMGDSLRVRFLTQERVGQKAVCVPCIRGLEAALSDACSGNIVLAQIRFFAARERSTCAGLIVWPDPNTFRAAEISFFFS
jgi:hypothetical protein